MDAKRLVSFLFIIFSVSHLVSGSKDISYVISESAIQSSFDLIRNAQGLGYCKYDVDGSFNYLISAEEAEIDLGNDKIVLDITFRAISEVGFLGGSFELRGSVTFRIRFGSSVKITYRDGYYRLALDDVWIEDFDINNFPDYIEEGFEAWFNSYSERVLRGLVLVDIPSPFPEVDSEYFETESPRVEITDAGIIFYLTVKCRTTLADRDTSKPDEYLRGSLSLYLSLIHI